MSSSTSNSGRGGMTTSIGTTRRRSSVITSATHRPSLKKDETCLKVEKMAAEREERRRQMQQRKIQREEENQRNIAAGNPGDVDFIGMVRKFRNEHKNDAKELLACPKKHPSLCICVRKRPINDKERSKNDHDSISVFNPSVWIHSAKLKVDGITKYLDHASYRFDYAFDETVSTDVVYQHTTMPLLDYACSGIGGRATVFAYGQTGSGKTHTMQGIQEILVEDLFTILQQQQEDSSRSTCCSLDNTKVMLSFFELYGGYIQDLLNNRERLKILEDGKGEINVTGLSEVEANDRETFMNVLCEGNDERTTHTTQANDTSSRSHAICQILLRDIDTDKLRGKLSLVDLAGSERGSDTKSHDLNRRNESSEINTSLLALKECIRALDKKGTGHVNYRASKLTLILKDCFASESAKTTMIATVSPGASSADHSLNTLRYADRVKEKRAATTSGGTRSPKRLSPARGRVTTAARSSSVTSAGGPTKSPKRLTPVRGRVTTRSSSSATATAPTKAIGGGQRGHSNTTNNLISPPPIVARSSSAAAAAASNARSTLNHKKETQRLRSSAGEENESPPRQQQQQSILEQEDDIFNLHMQNINENANLLELEGKMLQKQQDNILNKNNGGGGGDISEYAVELGKILDRKEDMILAFKEKIENFQKNNKKRLQN